MIIGSAMVTRSMGYEAKHVILVSDTFTYKRHDAHKPGDMVYIGVCRDMGHTCP